MLHTAWFHTYLYTFSHTLGPIVVLGSLSMNECDTFWKAIICLPPNGTNEPVKYAGEDLWHSSDGVKLL